MSFNSTYDVGTEHRPRWDAASAPKMVARNTSRSVVMRFGSERTYGGERSEQARRSVGPGETVRA
jgi:hypothetical protein